MCARTKPMKTRPLTAIRSFNAMVERVDLLFFTRVAVATTATVALRAGAEPPGRCDICPCTAIRARPLRFAVACGKSVPQHSPDGPETEVAMASTDAGVRGSTRAPIEARTLRSDRWWLTPLATFVVFTAFVIYASVRAFQGTHYYVKPYLSPFYSPCLGDCVEGASDFGQPFEWWPL